MGKIRQLLMQIPSSILGGIAMIILKEQRDNDTRQIATVAVRKRPAAGLKRSTKRDDNEKVSLLR
jgi:hypothetical protein